MLARMSAVVDDARARAFLAERYGGRTAAVAAVGRGDWSAAYAFRCDGAELVVRFGPEREDFEKDRLAGRYSSTELPMPRVLEIGEALGGSYAISERAHGVFLETLDESGMRTVLPSLLAALDALRRADVSAG